MSKLGILKKQSDLRAIWPHEAQDFSKWLAIDANLSLLGEAIGLDLVLEERESSVGNFNVDLYATEEGTGRRIIIENQLEVTDHDHLGKIITYAAGKNAEVIIWIVRHAKDEHKQAIEWLNQHTDENIYFFLVELELWQIGDSPCAPHFNVVERPNDWAKTVKVTSGLSETQKLQLEFWESFCDYAFSREDFKSIFRKRKAGPQHWYDLGLNSTAYHLNLTVNTKTKELTAGIYIKEDDSLYQTFLGHKQEIEAMFGQPLQWTTANKARRFYATTPGNIRQAPTNWPNLFDWLMETSKKMRAVARRFGSV